MKKAIILFFLALGVWLLACSDGTIPTATEPLIELQAQYVDQRPVLDGKGDDPIWNESRPFYVHIEPIDGEGKEFNIEFRAVWWREWAMTSGEWRERSYLGMLISWPDEKKDIYKQQWVYNAAEQSWHRTDKQSDWLILQWFKLAEYNDVWFWDAALTNPLGYAEDEYLQVSELEDSTKQVSLWIDGLNYRNDTDDEQNTWDLNYDDNMTPRDSTDDRPLWAWAFDVTQQAPKTPRISSGDEPVNAWLFKSDADFLKNTPYADPPDGTTVPGYALEEPIDDPADILAAGHWQDGMWTVELVRVASTNNPKDITFSPDDRYFQQTFFVAVGDNVPSPMEELDQSILISRNGVVLSFEYIPPRTSATNP